MNETGLYHEDVVTICYPRSNFFEQVEFFLLACIWYCCEWPIFSMIWQMPALGTPTDTPYLPAPLLINLQQICEIFSHKPPAFVVMLHLTKMATSINKHFLWLLSKPIQTLNHTLTFCFNILLWITTVYMINVPNCLCEHSLEQHTRSAFRVNQTEGQSKQTSNHS